MLINFSVTNWKSFKEETILSLRPLQEDDAKRQNPRLNEDYRILPLCALYGGNASGKTNFIEALDFVRRLVVYGKQFSNYIPLEPFLLGSKEDRESPSRFAITILVNDTIYRLDFTLTKEKVVEETLTSKDPNQSNQVSTLYNRQKKEVASNDTDEQQQLAFILKQTKNNQLFLTNAMDQQMDAFKGIYGWFEKLTIIYPTSRLQTFDIWFNFHKQASALLNQLDTGIDSIIYKKIPVDEVPSVTEDNKGQIEAKLPPGHRSQWIQWMGIKHYFIFREKNGKVMGCEVVASHLNEQGEAIPFDLKLESAGTIRLIDLLPYFVDLCVPSSKAVYVIDEIDRSLHQLLITALLEEYLEHSSYNHRAQLLFTTHNSHLMDVPNILRGDELWAVERNWLGQSSLHAIGEYKQGWESTGRSTRYQDERFGGTPNFRLKPIGE